MREKQYALFKERIPRHFGGSLLKGNAKVARPLSSKNVIHLVLKSRLAVGSRSFLARKNVDRIDALVRQKAKENGIRIYHFVNVGNHLHLVVKLAGRRSVGREAFHAFIRSVTGLIARQVLGVERGCAKGLKFWQARPFTRIVSWGRDFQNLNRYMRKNGEQAMGRTALVAWGFSVIDPVKISQLDTG